MAMKLRPSHIVVTRLLLGLVVAGSGLLALATAEGRSQAGSKYAECKSRAARGDGRPSAHGRRLGGRCRSCRVARLFRAGSEPRAASLLRRKLGQRKLRTVPA